MSSTSSPIEVYQFGSYYELYVQYCKRSSPFTMPSEHYHDFFEVYYLLSGKRTYFIHDRSYSVEPGDLVFIHKHELHKTMQVEDAAHERMLIHFSTETLTQISPSLTSFLLSPFEQKSHVIRMPKHDQLVIDQKVRQILLEIQKQKRGYELITKQNVVELLLHTARYLQTNEPPPLHHASPIHSKISEIVHYINKNFAEQLQLEALSQQFYISPYYLSRKFKEITGFSFSDYVMLTRIKEAQRLLRNSKISITEIAVIVGYDNFSHFGKMFKKITQLSPREYRKNHVTFL